MRATVSILGGAAALLCAAPAHAEQCVDFELANVSSATVAYNPFDPFDAATDLIIMARRTDATVSQVRFLLSDATRGAHGPELGIGGPAQYDIEWLDDPSRRVLATPGEEPTSLRAIVAGFDGANDMATEQLRLILPRGQAMSPGSASEQLDVVYECVGSNGEVVQRGMQPSRIRIAARHIPNFSVYVAGLGSRYGVLDLGALDVDAASTSGQLAIAVLSSVPYEMRMRSDNDLHLRRGEGEIADLIPYTVTVEGVEIDGRATLTCPSTPAPIGRTLGVEVAVPGPLRSYRAGGYSDVIVLSFSALDAGVPGSLCVRR